MIDNIRLHLWAGLLAAGLLAINSSSAQALDWHTTELHFTYGELDITTFAGGGTEHVGIVTFQHANGWQYGDNFLFVDFINGSQNGRDTYGEFYANISLEKVSGKEIAFGPVSDLGLVMGYNWGDDARVRKYLPGLRIGFDVPGFKFLNLTLVAYIDDNRGTANGGAPKQDDSYMVDASWALPWQWGQHAFSLEGHVEYIGSRDNEFGQKVEGHLLAQPQLRYDLGKTLWDRPNKIFIGFEFQYWKNKLGDANTDERVAQALAVYRF